MYSRGKLLVKLAISDSECVRASNSKLQTSTEKTLLETTKPPTNSLIANPVNTSSSLVSSTNETVIFSPSAILEELCNDDDVFLRKSRHDSIMLDLDNVDKSGIMDEDDSNDPTWNDTEYDNEAGDVDSDEEIMEVEGNICICICIY